MSIYFCNVVSNYGSSHQSVPGLMQSVDFEFEELFVSEPIGL